MALIAHWPLNGNTDDISGNENHGTNYGAVVSDNGKIGKCYEFAAGRYIDCPPIVVGNTVTIASWAYRTTDASQMIWAMFTDNHLNRFDLYFTNGTICLNTGDGGSNAFSTWTELNRWFHYTVIISPSKTHLYIDGNYVGSAAYRDPTTTNGEFFISRYSVSANYNWTGSINDVRVYDHALSDKEIQELAKAKVLHYSFNEFAEPTENLLASGLNGYNAFELSHWNGSGDFTNIGVSDFNTPIFRYDTAGSSYRYTHDYILDDNLSELSGKEVTFSIYVRRLDGPATGQIRIYDNVSGYSYFLIDAEVNFKRFTATKTIGLNPTRIFVMIDNTGGGTYELHSTQLEQKPYATPFTPGIREGIVTDLSGYGNDATLALATTPKWTSDAVLGTGAYKFGKQHNILTPIPMTTANFSSANSSYTFSAWVKLYNFPTFDSALIGGASYAGFALAVNATGFRTYYRNDTAQYGTSTFAPQLNEWYHIVGVIDHPTSEIKLYANGELFSSRSIILNSFRLESLTVKINSYQATGGNDFDTNDCSIDDVRIYATALSDTDVKELYQTRATLDEHGNLSASAFLQSENLFDPLNEASKDKVFKNGLSSYTQSNCSVTLTDRGLRIYRPPNLTQAADGNTMWGGLKIVNESSGGFTLQRYHTYRITMDIEGVSSNTFANIYWTNNMGWGGGGLTPQPTIIKKDYIPTNFSGTYKLTYEFYIPDEIYKVCTSAYSSFILGQEYLSYKHFAVGFSYSSTGPMGTDIYIRNFRMTDITDKTNINNGLESNGTFSYETFSELGPTDSLIAYYPFDGNAEDYSGNGNHGTVNGATLTSGIKGQGYGFDGVSNYIEIVDYGNDPVDALTQSFWFNPSLLPSELGGTYQDIIDKQGDTWNFFMYGTAITWKLVFEDLSSSPRAVISESWINKNEWNHIAGVFDTNTAKIYINGTKASEVAVGKKLRLSPGPIQIGRASNLAYNFNGALDEVRIYNRALTDEEIQILYDIYRPGGPKMLQSKDTLYVRGEIKEG